MTVGGRCDAHHGRQPTTIDDDDDDDDYLSTLEKSIHDTQPFTNFLLLMLFVLRTAITSQLIRQPLITHCNALCSYDISDRHAAYIPLTRFLCLSPANYTREVAW